MRREPVILFADKKQTVCYNKKLPKSGGTDYMVGLNNERPNQHKITLVVDNAEGSMIGESIKFKNILTNFRKRMNEKKPKTFIDLALLVSEVAEKVPMSTIDLFDYLTSIGWLTIGIRTIKDLKIEFNADESRVMYVIGKMVNETKMYSIAEDRILEELKSNYSMSREVATGIMNQLQKYSCIDIVAGNIVLLEDIETKTVIESLKNKKDKYETINIKVGVS